MRRSTYLLLTLGAVGLLAIVELLATDRSNDVVYYGGIATVVYLALFATACRLIDIGYSGWWSALGLAPGINVFLHIFCAVAPSDYARHRVLDTIAKALLALVAVPVVVAVAAVAGGLVLGKSSSMDPSQTAISFEEWKSRCRIQFTTEARREKCICAFNGKFGSGLQEDVFRAGCE